MADLPSFENYRTEKELGPGAYGVTYLVRDEVDNAFALKWLKLDAVADGKIRFENEVWALRKLQHPSIPRLIDTGERNDRPYIVMTYANGQTLRTTIEQNRR